MLTVEELEVACDKAELLNFSRHPISGPELLLEKMFYPFGFPVVIRTNSEEVLDEYEHLWGMFEKEFDTEPVQTEVSLVETDSTECPPTPEFKLIYPLMIAVADANNYSVQDLANAKTSIVLSRAALRNQMYARYHLLGSAVGCHFATRFTTPVHAAGVELDGRGVMLCGDSGAGKSTLSYACSRAGWTYVSDDCCFLLNDRDDRMVIGNCHQVRFRPHARELFSELAGLDLTPRAAGKPSIEMLTEPMSYIKRSQRMHVDYMVFINRKTKGKQQLISYRKDVARQYIRQQLFGDSETLMVNYKTIERALSVEVLEMQYQDLDWAIDRLQTLVRTGQ